jgi:hypothetical protein
MNKDWKVKFLPFLYRECPMGNAHFRSNHICYCCEGKTRNWTYVWRGSTLGWVPVEYVLDTSKTNHAAISWSGQLSTSDLIWNGLRTGLVLAAVIGTMAFLGLHFLTETGKTYQKNVQEKYERIQKNSE